jgi:4-aminobutyrate aminotransferase-like enzyme
MVKNRLAGLAMAGCGDKSLRFRPMLTYGKKHVDQTLEIMEKVAKTF